MSFISLLRRLFYRLRRDPIVQALLLVPRYTPGDIKFFGRRLRYTDSASLSFTYSEVFLKNIYKFKSDSSDVFIIDAGANIGISVLYFKMLYPLASVLAFEPDRQIFNVLKDNIQEFQLDGVKLINAGLWSHAGELEFLDEGADAGRICAGAKTKVTVNKLSDYLNRDVDLLKIDIEGAETKVLVECAQSLCRVKRIFVEYHSFLNEEQTLPELLALLKNVGFRLSISSPGLTSKNPFVNLECYNGMDMQLNIYGWRS